LGFLFSGLTAPASWQQCFLHSFSEYPTAPLRFFSLLTFHWVVLWLGLATFAIWRLLPMMGPCGCSYIKLIGAWGFIHLSSLSFHFWRSTEKKKVVGLMNKG
jgi:hypothetical protein